MNQREFVDYIRTERMKGTTKEQIIAHLSAAGWPAADVESAIAELDKAGTASPVLTIIKQPRNRVFRAFVIFCLCLVIVFTGFSILFNMGVITPYMPAFPDIVDSSMAPAPSPEALVPEPASTSPDEGTAPVASSTIPSVAVPPPAASPAEAPVSAPSASPAPESSSGNAAISSDDRDQVVAALLTQNYIFSSQNASNIRNYLLITASPAETASINGMDDSQVIAYAAGLIAGTQNMTGQDFLAPSVTWQETGDTIQLIIPVSDGSTVTRSSTEVSGVWY